jgi:hypothetical protein
MSASSSLQATNRTKFAQSFDRREPKPSRFAFFETMSDKHHLRELLIKPKVLGLIAYWRVICLLGETKRGTFMTEIGALDSRYLPAGGTGR